jgi:hypothetical protein
MQRFSDWIIQNNKITTSQFAYRSLHSAATQNIKSLKDQNQKVAILSPDLTKAFDRGNTRLLLQQLIRDKAPQ